MLGADKSHAVLPICKQAQPDFQRATIKAGSIGPVHAHLSRQTSEVGLIPAPANLQWQRQVLDIALRRLSAGQGKPSKIGSCPLDGYLLVPKPFAAV
jgi:hypothetical protein